MVVPWDSHDKICQDFNLNLPSSFCFLRFFIFANWGPEKHHSKNSTFLSVDFLEYPGESKGVYDSRSGVEDNFPGKKTTHGIFLQDSGRFSIFLPHFGMGKYILPAPRPRGPIGDPSGTHRSPNITEVQEGSTTFRDMPWVEVKAEANRLVLGN